jgi:hypothetical protein
MRRATPAAPAAPTTPLDRTTTGTIAGEVRLDGPVPR